MDIKALAIDLDGTLLVGEDLPAQNRDAIAAAAAAGLKVIIATARWRQMAERIAAEIGITAPIIACSGAQVYLPERREDIFDHRLEAEFARELYTLCDSMRCIATITAGDETLIKLDGEPDPDLLSEEMRWVPQLLPTLGDSPATRPRIAAVQGSKINATILADLAPRYAMLANFYDSVGPNGKSIMTITHKRASKGEALLTACQHLGIAPGSVLAFGDAENDIEMFRVAGASVAMGQATADIKAAATTTTLPNTEAGVGVTVRRLLDTGRLD